MRNCVGLIFSFRLAVRAHSDTRTVLLLLFVQDSLDAHADHDGDQDKQSLSDMPLHLPSHASAEPPGASNFGCAMISPADRN